MLRGDHWPPQRVDVLVGGASLPEITNEPTMAKENWLRIVDDSNDAREMRNAKQRTTTANIYSCKLPQLVA